MNGASVPPAIGISEREEMLFAIRKNIVQMPAGRRLTGGHVRNGERKMCCNQVMEKSDEKPRYHDGRAVVGKIKNGIQTTRKRPAQCHQKNHDKQHYCQVYKYAPLLYTAAQNLEGARIAPESEYQTRRQTRRQVKDNRKSLVLVSKSLSAVCNPFNRVAAAVFIS